MTTTHNILKHPAAQLPRTTPVALACAAAAALLAACGGGAAEGTPTPTASPVQTVAVKAEAPAHPTTLARGISHALGLWQPNLRYDTCSQAVHDAFAVVGPDGLRYPTWHPPTAIDPDTGKECSFGHEHGRDPRSSALWPAIREHFAFDANANGVIDQDELAQAGLPFGYVNQQLDVYNAQRGIVDSMRHEDHVGHKIEWENDLPLQTNQCNTVSGPGCWDRVALPVRCDFLMKPHQGTHTADAFTNNMHELVYAVACRDDGSATGEVQRLAATRLITAHMSVFGKPGGFTDRNTGQFVEVGQCTPANSPTGQGARLIPVAASVQQKMLVPSGQFSDFGVVYEDWLSSNRLTTADGREIVRFDPHFAVFSPSRYYMPAGTPEYGVDRSPEDRMAQVARSSDLCYMRTPDGRRAKGIACDLQTDYGRNMVRIDWDDPRSQFNGVKREMYFNQTVLTNPGGPTLWWTDPLGRQAVPDAVRAARPQAYVGFVRHWVQPVDNRTSFFLESQAIGSKRSYGHPTVHAPN